MEAQCCDRPLLPPALSTGLDTDAHDYTVHGTSGAQCDYLCPGNQGQLCGGLLSISVYEVVADCSADNPLSNLAVSLAGRYMEVAGTRTAAETTIACAAGYVSTSRGRVACYSESAPAACLSCMQVSCRPGGCPGPLPRP